MPPWLLRSCFSATAHSHSTKTTIATAIAAATVAAAAISAAVSRLTLLLAPRLYVA